jgi:hypothetical protein
MMDSVQQRVHCPRQEAIQEMSKRKLWHFLSF